MHFVFQRQKLDRIQLRVCPIQVLHHVTFSGTVANDRQLSTVYGDIVRRSSGDFVQRRTFLSVHLALDDSRSTAPQTEVHFTEINIHVLAMSTKYIIVYKNKQQQQLKHKL